MSDADRQKWESRYRDALAAPQVASQHLQNIADLLPTRGSALDIAGGAGRNAIWLAKRGLDVTMVDISEAGLAIARDRVEAAGVSIHTQCQDLETTPLPAGPSPTTQWDVVMSFHYLQRSLWPAMRAALAPGGLLVFVQPTIRNLERHAKPPRDFLLADGEGLQVASGLEVVRYEEGWLCEGRHEVLIVARRSPSSALQS